MVFFLHDAGRPRVERVLVPRLGLVIGRDPEFFLGRRSDTGLAPAHAQLRREGAASFVRVLDDDALSRINGHSLHGEVTLRHGDVLRFGELVFVFATADAPEEGHDERSAGGDWGSGLAAVRRSVDMVAPYRHSVVIMGETGTGKEVVAQRIHGQSGRQGPFVAVNCAMLSESLLASELFGHVRGAFTGATSDQQGLFRAANHGTLLLDEVSDMPLALQASLLRVLETGMVRPVGSTKDIPNDARIVATTHRDLIELVHAERFRADLYARLAQWTVRVPPLRERRQDIPGLVRHLVTRVTGAPRGLTADLAEALLVHQWPLNVRGLVNTLSIASIASPPGRLLDLHEEVRLALWSARSLTGSEAPEPPVELDKATLVRALAHEHGRVATVARQLGVSRPRLYRLFACYGIDPEGYRNARASELGGEQPGGESRGDGGRHGDVPAVEVIRGVE